LKVVVKDEDGNLEDLSAYTAKLSMIRRKSGDVKINGVSCDMTGAASGEIVYNWASGDLDEPGEFLAEVTLFDGSSLRQTLDQFVIFVREKIN